MNLTGGFRGLTRVPRPLRPYRTPLPRPNQPDIKHRDQVETERLSIKNEPTCEEDLREANTADAHTCSSDESAGVMAKKISIFSTGVNWDAPTKRFALEPTEQRALELASHLVGHNASGSAIMIIDCRGYKDPEAQKNSWLRGHVGTHPLMARSQWQSSEFFRDMLFYVVGETHRAAATDCIVIFSVINPGIDLCLAVLLLTKSWPVCTATRLLYIAVRRQEAGGR